MTECKKGQEYFKGNRKRYQVDKRCISVTLSPLTQNTIEAERTVRYGERKYFNTRNPSFINFILLVTIQEVKKESRDFKDIRVK